MKLDFRRLYLSREGRLDRTTFWIAALILVSIFMVVRYIAGVFLSAVIPIASPQAVQAIAFILRVGLPLAFLYPAYCLFVKRGFDRDRPALIVQVLITVLAVVYLLPKILVFGAQPDTTKSFLQGLETAAPMIYLALAAATAYVLVDYGLKSGTKGTNRFGGEPLPV